jgi:hypothetical protein
MRIIGSLQESQVISSSLASAKKSGKILIYCGALIETIGAVPNKNSKTAKLRNSEICSPFVAMSDA